MQEQSYIPIAIEGIEPMAFPDVALYLKTGGNFVLYKSHGRDFSQLDADRLTSNKVEFLYVSPQDMDVINEYMEANVERFLKSEELTRTVKGKMIFQTSINFINDLFSNPKKTNDSDRIRRLIENLLTYLSGDVRTLSTLETVIAHNYHTFVHSLQVTALSIMIHSEAYMLKHDEMMDVGIGTLLHDFGKTFLPDEILNKTGRLTEEEIARFKRHPEEGYSYLKENTNLNDIALAIVRMHHERNNGNGYPRGIRGELIPRGAQVASACDFFCNMTMGRDGNKIMSPNICLHIMRHEMKGAFNEQILKALESIVCTDDTESNLPL
ncbi:cyclic di-GMP phosphodiesterase response regulator RpfG [Geobacter sp. OR-1]|uniref:HD-GYP domain-containing protein n=1 Tax=Geobacter sp. OR-1 TaxID=1266765 RepID=UPI0005435D27|nr:HD domain-containing phosphohydrolase [Geobacter sp. OR-1]GAM09770.1 cyclic di-GMP phosphodiesterase response regulator RpfG [Geobacter sp. OR-1]